MTPPDGRASRRFNIPYSEGRDMIDMKKYALCLATVLILTALFILPASSAETVDGGACGDGLSWTLDSDGTLTISGTGPMYDYPLTPSGSAYNTTAPWAGYFADIKTVEIEDGVTGIGGHAFYLCRELKSVTIPDSVRSIGEGAFCYCERLKEVKVPDGVQTVSDSAFAWCGSLERAELPDSLTGIGDSAFAYCNSLTGITVPGSVKTIGQGAFKYCTWLFSAAIPEGVTEIEDNTFSACKGLQIVEIPLSVTRISTSAFEGDVLSDVYYGGGESEWAAIWEREETVPPGPGTVIIGVPGQVDLERYRGGRIHYNSRAPEIRPEDFWNTVEFNGHRYCVFEIQYAFGNPTSGTTASFWKAEKFCEAQGGHLATLTSPEENSFVLSYASPTTSGYVYFGLYYDWDESEWKWVTGEPVDYTAWRTYDEYGPQDGGYARYIINVFGNHATYSTRWENARFLMTELSSYIGNSVFVCEWDDGAVPAEGLDLSVSDGVTALTGTLDPLDRDAVALCAAYDEDGRMLQAQSVLIGAGEERRELEFIFQAEADSVKLFLLDPQTRIPLFKVWDSKE